jgi:hypothetical protein
VDGGRVPTLAGSQAPKGCALSRSVSFDPRRKFVNYCRPCLAHDFVLGIGASRTTDCADNIALVDQWNTASRRNDSIGTSGRFMWCPLLSTNQDATRNAYSLRKRLSAGCPDNAQLVQERFPVGWHPSCGSRCGLIFGMRVRWKQLHTFDHPTLLVIVEPVLTWLKAGDDRMPCRRRMLGCMLTRRTVTASDVPTLRTPTKMKPPTFRGRQAFHTSVATWFRSGIKSAMIFLHFEFSFRCCMSSKEFKPPARSSRHHLFLPLLELRPLH